MKKPTEAQLDIISFNGNTVVTASPGSGKTFCLVEKIKKKLPGLSDFEGFIAITFTNKAAREIKNRLMGESLANSFIGTLDSFYFSEIILPFSRFITRRKTEIEIVNKSLTENSSLKDSSETEYKLIGDKLINYIEKGEIPINMLSECAYFILTKVPQCSLYFKSKYKLILIDEYQDCSEIQHKIFKFITELNIEGFCVGDVNQSIYKFANKSSRYLKEIVGNPGFKHFELIENKRSHKSIVDYAIKLLSPKYEVLPLEDKRVKKISVNGDEKLSVKGIEKSIEGIKKKFNIESNNRIAILCKTNASVERISSYFDLQTKMYLNSPFNQFQIRSEITSCLTELFSAYFEYKVNKMTVTEFCEVMYTLSKKEYILIKKIIQQIFNSNNLIDSMNTINAYVLLRYRKELSIDEIILVRKMLSNESEMEFFKPATNDEIQIMNYHRSKGLEFEAVFLFDNHKYIFPNERDNKYYDIYEDLRTHYVALTRASKVCYLMQGNSRYSYYQKKIIKAYDSDFLSFNNLALLRENHYWFYKK